MYKSIKNKTPPLAIEQVRYLQSFVIGGGVSVSLHFTQKAEGKQTGACMHLIYFEKSCTISVTFRYKISTYRMKRKISCKEMMKTEDKDIVELYWRRDQQAISLTEKKYGKMLLYLSNSFLHSISDAEECVSDTYLQAWNSMPDKRPAFLGAFLSKIVRGISIDKYRKIGKKQSMTSALTEEMEECIPDSLTVDAIEENEHLKTVLNSFISSLPDEHRVMFIRRYFNGDSVFVIAQRLACTESKVKTTLFRIREKLKNTLEKEGLM